MLEIKERLPGFVLFKKYISTALLNGKVCMNVLGEFDDFLSLTEDKDLL
jgi:hypothetical protein